jgi:signal transduction histidine kinase
MSARLPELHLKTTVTDKLTRTYLRKLSRQNYIATASTALIVTFSLIWLIFQIGGYASTAVTFFANSMYALTSLIGAYWACITAYRARYGPLRLEPRHQLAWLFIGIGLFTNGVGAIIYIYLQDSVQKNPLPSPADIGFTLFYIFTFIGLLYMPTEPNRRESSVLIALDALITTICALGVSWYFVIEPIFGSQMQRPDFSLGNLYVAVSHPFLDILLIFAIVLLIRRRVERMLYPSLLLIGIGIICQIWADSFYGYLIPLNTYHTGTPYIDTFWFIAYLLMGLAALYQYAAIARRVFRERSNTSHVGNTSEYVPNSQDEGSHRRYVLLQSLLIYIPLAILLALTLYSEITYNNQLSFSLVVTTIIVAILVTIRYLCATHENEILLREREQRREIAELLRILATQLTEELVLDHLLTRIVTIAASALGFDAVMLLLAEDYDRSLDKQSILLVRAASSIAPEVYTWRFQGEQLHLCSVLAGKQIDIVWAEQKIDVPEDIRAWQKEQQILATLFVSLTYQGKTHGSLGFARRKSRPLSEPDIYLAKAYTEEAASAIEHAYLYQAAREHELFSQALANIAARLNSAVASGTSVGTEILQLICTEGANALQADYTLLYVNDYDGPLVPAAIYVNEREPVTRPGDWPPIQRHEFEARALGSLQPVLIQINDLSTSSGHLSAVSSGSLPAVSGKIPAVTASSARQSFSDTLPRRSPTGGLRGRRNPTLREVLQQRNVPTAILAPLISGNTAVGLLILARSIHAEAQPKKAFATADLPQAQDFAEQAAIAFTNAQLYQELRNAHQQLQQLDQMKDQFMITASHELRTPLTAVQGYLELLAEYGGTLSLEQQQEFLQKARRGCDELVLLLSNVMDASRLEIEAGIRPAHLARVSVQDEIRGVIELIEPQVTQENREVYMYVPNKLFVKTDPTRLRQVLLNLSVNALKYSNPGTPVTFSARAVIDQVPGAIISVTDKGKGIKPEDQALLFQRFTRLESDLNSTIRGSGLGLYISRRLIEAMDGKIWIESSGVPGAGSTFHIQLPLA